MHRSCTTIDAPAVALLGPREFARARGLLCDLNGVADYAEWREGREALQIGLAMAGLDARLVRVQLDPFLAWRRLTGTPFSEAGLDAFASAMLAFNARPAPRVVAAVVERDFAAHDDALGDASIGRGYRDGSLGRNSARRESALAGRPITELPIRLDDFVAWRRCVGAFPASSIDRYAELLMEWLASGVDEDEFDGR